MGNLQLVYSNFIYLIMPMILDKGIGCFAVGSRGGGGGSPRGQVNEIYIISFLKVCITDKAVNLNLCSKIFY